MSQQTSDLVDYTNRTGYDVNSSPPRHFDARNPQDLYQRQFSASQTALLSREGLPLTPLTEDEPLPHTVVHPVTMSNQGPSTDPYGSTSSRHPTQSDISMIRSPSIADTFSSNLFFLPVSASIDSVGILSASRYPSTRSPQLSPGGSPKSGFRSLSGGIISSSDHSCLSGEKSDGDGTLRAATSYNIDYVNGPEPDDYLHAIDSSNDGRNVDKTGTIFTARGAMNIGFLFILALGLLMLFAGYPVLTVILEIKESNKGGFNLGGTNASGQIPYIRGLPSLIDADTPKDAYTKLSADGTKTLKLVYSDEFNKDGRSFYPGDDPYWEAVDLNYWGTGNYEWYDPAGVTTENGSLVITLSETVDHNLNFRGGMITTWNKMCFTGGQIEIRAMLPGSPDISGLWPAAWTMGNLGRAGYGATTDGMWPYTYDTCDVGTLHNQTYPTGGPVAAETTGVFVEQYGPGLSYLPGQRLSRCTCPNSKDHPGPHHPDGTWVGRSAPEIDIIEAQASNTPGSKGHVSMSLQLAPYDSGYNLTNTDGSYIFYNDQSQLNTYTGAVYQQAASGIVQTKRNVYEDNGAAYDTWGFEYKPGGDPDSYITWMNSNQPMWRLNPPAMGPNSATEIGQRLVPPEPMYILLNLGISSSFTYINWKELHFPAKFRIDYVRIWQPEDEENIGCDPPNYPTQKYINEHMEAYTNANLTTWTQARNLGGYNHTFPGNTLLNQC